MLPSRNESFGNAAAEVVAAGVPVLLTDACGIAPPVIHGRAGMAVPLGIKCEKTRLRPPTANVDDEAKGDIVSLREHGGNPG